MSDEKKSKRRERKATRDLRRLLKRFRTDRMSADNLNAIASVINNKKKFDVEAADNLIDVLDKAILLKVPGAASRIKSRSAGATTTSK